MTTNTSQPDPAPASDHPDPRAPLTRRRLLRTAVAAFVGFAAHGLTRSRPAAALDNCYWQTMSTVCVSGRRWAYRCEICCAGGSCETVQCLWVDIGPC